MSINHILIIIAVLCAIAFVAYFDHQARKEIDAWCNTQEPVTVEDKAHVSAYCGESEQ